MERQMKDSGLPWIGTIPCQWSTKPNKHVMHKIKEIQDIYKGENILSLSTDGVKVRDLDAGGKMPSSFNGYQCVKPGNLLMCLFDIDVTPRCIGLVKNEGLTSPAYSQFVLKEEAHAPYFYYYYLALDNDKTLVHLAKNLRHSLTEDQLGAISVIFPPLEEQQRIAAYLDSTTQKINEAIEKAKDLIEQYKAYKKSLISETVTKGINSDVELKDTDYTYWPTIPCHWIIRDVKYLFEIVKRIAGKEGYDILSVTQKGLKKKDISTNEGQIAENYSGYQFVYPTDFVMNHMDLLTGWVDVSTLFGVTSPDYRVFRLRDRDNNSLSYFKYVLQCCYLNKIFYSLGRGVSNLGRWRLQSTAFNNFKFPVPPLKEQQEIAAYLDRKCSIINRLIEEKEALITRLQSYRKSVIYEYVTGKKQVPQ